LTTRVFAAAPGAGIEFLALTGEPLAPDRAIVEHDVLIGPLGHGFPGTGEVLFRDRMVCLVDRANPRLRHGTLTLDDLRELPHAVASFGRDILTPADRVMGELAVTPRAQVTVAGWLAVPAVVEGTDMVAVVPERLRDQFAGNPALAVVEPPFDRVNLIEGFWYQQAKASEPALGWLLSILREVAAELDV
jgi:DNA-binding transcriptional LysR family regulator